MSFAAEHRVDEAGFNRRHELLEHALVVGGKMSDLAMRKCQSERIKTKSRLAQAPIILDGGRIIEVMRTHGVSSSFARKNFERVLDAINACEEYHDNDDDSRLLYLLCRFLGLLTALETPSTPSA